MIFGFLIYSCAVNSTKLEKDLHTAQRVLLIFIMTKIIVKIQLKKMDDQNIKFQTKMLKTNSLIKIINPKTNDSITVLKNKENKLSRFL